MTGQGEGLYESEEGVMQQWELANKAKEGKYNAGKRLRKVRSANLMSMTGPKGGLWTEKGGERVRCWFYAFGDNFLNTIYRQYLIDHKPFIKVALAGFLHTILGDCHVIFMIN